MNFVDRSPNVDNATLADDRELGIGVARRQLETLDRQIEALLTQRRAVAAYLSAMTGQAIPELPAAQIAAQSNPPGAGGDGEEMRERISPSRQFNKRVVQEALDIIARHGRPMTAPDIHEEHSQAASIGTEALYRLMYNRVIAGSLYSFAGAFWPVREPIPVGWDLSMAKRQHDPAVAKQRGGKRR